MGIKEPNKSSSGGIFYHVQEFYVPHGVVYRAQFLDDYFDVWMVMNVYCDVLEFARSSISPFLCLVAVRIQTIPIHVAIHA